MLNEPLLHQAYHLKMDILAKTYTATIKILILIYLNDTFVIYVYI
jgi:hypothetical protein